MPIWCVEFLLFYWENGQARIFSCLQCKQAPRSFIDILEKTIISFQIHQHFTYITWQGKCSRQYAMAHVVLQVVTAHRTDLLRHNALLLVQWFNGGIGFQ